MKVSNLPTITVIQGPNCLGWTGMAMAANYRFKTGKCGDECELPLLDRCDDDCELKRLHQ